MAYVVPNTTIYLLSDVPLSSDQRDTYYFDNATQQQNYFRSKIAYTFTQQSYQRVNSGTIRVQLSPAQNIYQCNYLMFSNTNHWNGKWFYAFIDKIDYVNENCAEISYTLDDIQTWFFDYVEEQCLVIRQSPYNDAFGSNLQDEGFACGEYVQSDHQHVNDLYNESGYKGDYIGILYLNNTEDNDGRLIDGVYTAGIMYVFRCTDDGVTAADNFIKGHISKTEDGVTSYYPDNILGVFMIPHEAFKDNQQPTNGLALKGEYNTAPRRVQFNNIVPGTTQIAGYVPHYNKLYTSPYNFFVLDMGNGQSQNYKYEFFGDDVDFLVDANIIPPCSITYYPYDYKSEGTGGFVYTAEQVGTSTYPVCSWSTDAWAAWLGQNTSMPLTTQNSQWGDALQADPGVNGVQAAKEIGNMLLNPKSIPDKVSSIFGSVVSKMSTGSFTGKDLVESIISTNPAYRASDIVKGTVYNGSNWYASVWRKKVTGRRMTITREYAEKIDKYFDAFGYALNQVTTPLRRARTRYTYVQTMGCSVKGRISNEVRERIAKIYDNGVRFWNFSQTGDTLGTYTLRSNNSLG